MLDDLFDQLTQAAAAGPLVLDRRSLPSRAALRLFGVLLGSETLVFDTPEVSREGELVRLDGTTSLLGLDHCEAVATFAMAGSELAVSLTLFPYEGWWLSDSFPALAGTPFASMALVEPQLQLATHDPDGNVLTVRDGLWLLAGVPVSDILPALDLLPAKLAQVELQGPIRHARSLITTDIDAAETLVLPRLDGADTKHEIELSAALPLALDVPGLAFSDVALVIEGPQVVDFAPYPDVRRGLRARVTLAGETVDVFVGVGDGGLLSLRASPEDLRLADLGKLAGGFGSGLDLAGSLPDGLKSFGQVRLTEIDADIDLTQGKLTYLGLGIARNEAWSAAEGLLSLANPSAYFMISDPTEKSRRIGCCLQGEVAVGGIVAQVEAFAPEYILSATLPDLPLSRLIAIHAPELAEQISSLPEIDLRNVRLTLSPKSGEMSFRAESDSAWTLAIGVTPLAVRDLVIEINRRPGAGKAGATVSGLIAGRMQVAQADLEVAYAFPGDLVLRAEIPELSFSPLLQAIAGTGALRDLPLPPGLLDLKLDDVYVAIAPQRRTFSLAAGTPVGDMEVVFAKTRNGAWGCAVGIAPAKDWRFSSLAPELAVLDALSLANTRLVIATADDGSLMLSTIVPGRPDLRLNRDEIATAPPAPLDVRVHRGVNIFSTISLAGTGADEVLGRGQLTVYAALGPSLADLALEARIETSIKLAEGVTMGDVGFLLRPSPTAFSITLFGVVQVRVGKDDLVFRGGLEVQPRGASIQATMLGTWTNAFGAKGFDISNLALDLGLSFGPPIPTIGLAGTLALGSVRGSAAVRFDSKNPGRSMLAVAFNRLFLSDVVDAFCDDAMTRGVPPEVRQYLTTIGLTDVNVYLAPLPTRIGELNFDAGLNLAGVLILPGFTAAIRINVDQARGILAEGAMTPIDIAGLFKITGNRNPAGPSFKLVLRTGEPFLVQIDGTIQVLHLQASAFVHLAPDGFAFEITGRIFEAFEATVRGRGGSVGSSAGFLLSVTMHNDLPAYLADKASHAIQESAAAAIRDLTAAQNAIDAEQRKLSSLDVVIEAARNQVRADRARDQQNFQNASNEVQRWRGEVQRLNGVVMQQRAVVNAERQRDQRNLNNAANAVQGAQTEVNRLQGLIDEQKRWIGTLEGQIAAKQRWVDEGNILEKIGRGIVFTGFSAAKGAEITTAYGKIGGLEAAKGAAWGILEGTKATLREMSRLATKVPVDMDLRVAGPLGSMHAAQLALDGAIATLQGMKQISQDLSVDVDPRVSGPIALRETARLELMAAKAVLEGLKQTVGGLAEAGTFIVQNGLNGLIDIKSAGFECSLQAGHGGEVELQIVVSFMRRAPQSFLLAFNFHDPLAGAKRMAEQLTK